jgi:hypothetical protein
MPPVRTVSGVRLPQVAKLLRCARGQPRGRLGARPGKAPVNPKINPKQEAPTPRQTLRERYSQPRIPYRRFFARGRGWACRVSGVQISQFCAGKGGMFGSNSAGELP